jgi:hypothetical protein
MERVHQLGPFHVGHLVQERRQLLAAAVDEPLHHGPARVDEFEHPVAARHIASFGEPVEVRAQHAVGELDPSGQVGGGQWRVFAQPQQQPAVRRTEIEAGTAPGAARGRQSGGTRAARSGLVAATLGDRDRVIDVDLATVRLLPRPAGGMAASRPGVIRLTVKALASRWYGPARRCSAPDQARGLTSA